MKISLLTISIFIYIICIFIFIISISFTFANLWISNNVVKYIEIKEVLKGRSCVEEVERYCYNQYKYEVGYSVNTKKYNKCKINRIFDDCSVSDCVEIHGLGIIDPKSTKEEVQDMVDKHFIQPEVMECFEMEER